MTETTIDAYERVLIQETAGKGNSLFLYALHYANSNHISIGFGMESKSGLQKAHLPGPNVHELHAQLLAEWLRDGGIVGLIEDKTPRTHLFTSALDAYENINYRQFLKNTSVMHLTAGRYMPLVVDARIWPERASAFADAVSRVHSKAFGHPLDWDVQNHSLRDGRFVWSAYDSDLGKIRIGMGYFDESNIPLYGAHTYACSQREMASFVALHYHYLDAPLQFMGLPPRWPDTLNPLVTGKTKQAMVTALLKHADTIWPGEVTGN